MKNVNRKNLSLAKVLLAGTLAMMAFNNCQKSGYLDGSAFENASQNLTTTPTNPTPQLPSTNVDPNIVGVPAALQFNSISSNALAGINFGLQPQVSVVDAYGNVGSPFSYHVSIEAYSDANCTIHAPNALNANFNTVDSAGGLATFNGVNYPTSGTIYVGSSVILANSLISLFGITLPEESTLNLKFYKPQDAATALVTLDVFDADMLGEGELYINGSLATTLFTTNQFADGLMGPDSMRANASFSVPASLFVNGNNQFRFTHLLTAGYDLYNVTVQFNGGVSSPPQQALPTNVTPACSQAISVQ